MNSSNPVRDFGTLGASGLLLYRADQSALDLGAMLDQVKLGSVPMFDFRVEFASREVQQGCDLRLERQASLAMLLTRLEPSGFVCCIVGRVDAAHEGSCGVSTDSPRPTEHHRTPKPNCSRRQQPQPWAKIVQNSLQGRHSMFFKRRKIQFPAIGLAQLMLIPGVALARGSLVTS